MLRNRIAAALCGLALFVAADARANWEYTRWEMSVAEVEAVASGSRRLTSEEASNLDRAYDGSVVPKVVAPYRMGEIQLAAVFHFASDDGGLEFVELLLLDGMQSQALKDLLRGKYGEPAEEQSDFFGSNTFWVHDGDIVQLMESESTMVRIQPK